MGQDQRKNINKRNKVRNDSMMRYDIYYPQKLFWLIKRLPTTTKIMMFSMWYIIIQNGKELKNERKIHLAG